MVSSSLLTALAAGAATLVSAMPAGNFGTDVPICPFQLQISDTNGGTPTTHFIDDVGGPVADNLNDSGHTVTTWQLDSAGRLKVYTPTSSNNNNPSYLLQQISKANPHQFPGYQGLIVQPLSITGRDYAAVQCSKYKIYGKSNGYGPPPYSVWLKCHLGNTDTFQQCDYNGKTKNPREFVYLKGGSSSHGSGYGSGYGSRYGSGYGNGYGGNNNNGGCKTIYLKVVPQTQYFYCNSLQ